MKISVVVPVFNEAEGLPPLYATLCEALAALPGPAEVVFVDDGSRDRSADLLEEFALADPRIHVIRLRRNYGQTAAMMAGIQHSTGDVIVPMDADGQNDPRDIPLLLAKLTSAGVAVE